MNWNNAMGNYIGGSNESSKTNNVRNYICGSTAKAPYNGSQTKTTGKLNYGSNTQHATTFKPQHAPPITQPVAYAASIEQIINDLLAENASLQQKIGYGSGLIDENVYIRVLRQYNGDLQEIRNKMEQEYQAR